jgi:GR25 family glycosyltransferase involved in LPS biosynthesis
MSIPIFCINLERATERKAKIQKFWIDKLGFDITFFKAWDRRDIDNGHFYFRYDSELTQKTIRKQLTSGEIACATSHCMVYEYALSLNLDHCIVMEDDILPSRHLTKDIFNKILLVKKEMPQCSIVLLHEIYNKINDTLSIKESTNFTILDKWPFGNQMTFFTKNGLQIMFNNLKNLNYLADHWNIFPYSDPKKDICIIKKSIGRHEYSTSKDTSTFIGERSLYYKNYKP